MSTATATARYRELESRIRALAVELLPLVSEAKALEKFNRDHGALRDFTGFAGKAMPQHSVDTLSAWLES